MAGYATDRLGYPVMQLPAEVISSSDSVIHFLIGRLVEQGRIPEQHASRAACQVVSRERQGSTALGSGVAVPHSKSEVPEPVGIVGRSTAPISWETSHDVPVYEVCLLLLPAYNPREHLRTLEAVVGILSRNHTREEVGAI